MRQNRPRIMIYSLIEIGIDSISITMIADNVEANLDIRPQLNN